VINLRKLNFGLIIILIVVIGASIGYSQNTYDFDNELAQRYFVVDYAQFKSDENGLNRLEIYYKLFNSCLQFAKDGDNYKAEYEIAITIYDDDNRQMTAFTVDKSIIFQSYVSTTSSLDYRISQINRKLPPGKYTIDLLVSDKNSGMKIKRCIKPKLLKYDNKNPQLSGIEFIQAVDVEIIDTVFRKGDMTVIPNVGSDFTGDSSASLLYYFEIYRGSKSKGDYPAVTRILDHRHNPLYSDTITIRFDEDDESDEPIRQIRQIAIKDLKSNDYTLEVSLLGRRNRAVDRSRSNFRLVWDPDAMLLYDHETAILQLKYIADPHDIKNLEESENHVERLKVWEEFWLSRDPSPETPKNEAKESYYYRIFYANRHFSVMRKPGWKTDRGMVFIQYGKPDQIEDYPFELSSKAYQIWYYYTIGERRRFVFIDEWNDGDFILQYPYDGRSW